MPDSKSPVAANSFPLAVLMGLMLLCTGFVVTLISPRFHHGGNPLERPIAAVVALLVLWGFVYLAALALLFRSQGNSRLLAWVVLVGLGGRLTMFFSVPILEDDFYRYLWDGGVTAHGYNPYAYVPLDAMGLGKPGAAPDELGRLGVESGMVAERVNHPRLGTVYPPLAQAAFAVSHWVRPWSLGAWRGVLLVCEIATMGMLCLLLHRMGKPLHFVAVYWWNPVVIKETANSAHMDALVLPFVLISTLYALQNRSVRSGLFLALAACVKIWPAILALAMIRTIRNSAKRIALACTLSLAVVAILSLPMIPAFGLGERSGFFAYGQQWEMNDALFMVFHKGVQWTALALGFAQRSDGVDFSARIVVFCALIAWVVLCSARRIDGPEDLANRLVLILGALFMLSPAQFPWYYVWVVPFLALSPRPSLLVLTAMLPLYYLKFHFSARENVDLFHNGIVWIEYAPTFVLILWESRMALLRRRAGAGA